MIAKNVVIVLALVMMCAGIVNAEGNNTIPANDVTISGSNDNVTANATLNVSTVNETALNQTSGNESLIAPSYYDYYNETDTDNNDNFPPMWVSMVIFVVLMAIVVGFVLYTRTHPRKTDPDDSTEPDEEITESEVTEDLVELEDESPDTDSTDDAEQAEAVAESESTDEETDTDESDDDELDDDEDPDEIDDEDEDESEPEEIDLDSEPEPEKI